MTTTDDDCISPFFGEPDFGYTKMSDKSKLSSEEKSQNWKFKEKKMKKFFDPQQGFEPGNLEILGLQQNEKKEKKSKVVRLTRYFL